MNEIKNKKIEGDNLEFRVRGEESKGIVEFWLERTKDGKIFLHAKPKYAAEDVESRILFINQRGVVNRVFRIPVNLGLQRNAKGQIKDDDANER